MSMPGGGSPVGSAVPVGGLLRLFPAGGGTTFDQALAGSLTPAGSLDTRVLLLASIDGNITPAGALLKQIRVSKAGTLTPAGALLKKAKVTIAGSVAPVGAMLKTIATHLAGSISPSGDVLVTWYQSLSGAITATGSLLANHIVGGAARVISGIRRMRIWGLFGRK